VTDTSKGFDRPSIASPAGPGLSASVIRVAPAQVSVQLAAEARRIEVIKAQASPPPAMIAAPMAPARGPQQLVPSFTVTTGGMRRVEGAHWQGLSPLAAAVAQARMRHDARHPDAAFVPPYDPAQVAVAEDYAALVEWRGGSAMRCASLEGGRSGGGGSGLYIDSFIDQGKWLATLHARIGDGVAMSPRRNMDRGNGRRAITVRAAVDMLCLTGVPVKTILQRFGWVGNIREMRDLRTAICGALDRMQGYTGEGGAK
jgi:hypothetical protein